MHGLPLRTPSLLLRRFELEDAPRILALNAEASTRRWLPSHVYADLAQARSALGRLIAAYAEPGDPARGPYVLAVVHADTARLLGHVGFSPLQGEVEVSYAIAESDRGRGFGGEALDCACDWALRSFGLPRLVAVTAVANAASRRVLERAGFVHERDEAMSFQGDHQVVSRHCRTASAA